MWLRGTLLSGCLIAVCLGCAETSAPLTDAAAARSYRPADLQQIDRVSLLAWKETLGPKYPLTVARADSIALILDFFSTTSAQWKEQATVGGIPMLAGFYRAGQLESQRGFVETSHGAGGLLVIQERGKLYSRVASPADIARFLSFFGVSVELYPN